MKKDAKLQSDADDAWRRTRQAAHDIRSPLSALRILSAKIPESSELAGLVKAAVERLDSIATDLLGSMPARRAAFSISHAFLQQTIALKMTEHLVPMTVKIQANDPVFVGLSETTMACMLSNLINNSVEADASIIRMELSAGDGRIHIDVVDDGAGIPEALIGRVGLEELSFGKVGGLGLGLSQVFKEVRRAGGEVRVASRAGFGTTISFWLPIIT